MQFDMIKQLQLPAPGMSVLYHGFFNFLQNFSQINNISTRNESNNGPMIGFYSVNKS